MKSLIFVMAAGVLLLAAGPLSAQTTQTALKTKSAPTEAVSAAPSGEEKVVRRPRAAERQACRQAGGHMRRGDCVIG